MKIPFFLDGVLILSGKTTIKMMTNQSAKKRRKPNNSCKSLLKFNP